MFELLKNTRQQILVAWLCLGITIAQILAAGSIVHAWPTQASELIVCDVGQGDAILVKDRFSHTLIDAGTESNSVLHCLTNHIPWFDTRLDLFIATHPDSDHIGGAEAVLNRFEVTQVMINADAKSTAVFAGFREAVLRKKESGAKLLFPKDLVNGRMAHSIEYQVLSPQERVDSKNVFIQEATETTLSDVIEEYEREIKNYNERSIVLFLNIKGTTVLLPGDIETTTETALTKTNLLTQVDILKVPHHGSKTSSTPQFIDKVVPEVALFSVGQKNRFGHPSPDVISRFESIGTRVMRTDEQGEIRVSITDAQYEVTTQR